jgi:hypothetical protein
MAIPLSIAGWGLREGVAAWAFAAAGFGAATGVTVATLYAVLMLVAVTPGAGLLLGDAVRRRRDLGQRDLGRPGEPSRPGPVPLETVDAGRPYSMAGFGTPLTGRSSWREAERPVA